MKQNRTTLILTAVVCILCGLLLIYRGQQTLDHWYKFTGTVTNLTIQEFPGHKRGYRYSLDFALAETDQVYGIYLGTKDQAAESKIKNKIDIGQTYTFYIDQTVAAHMRGHILGIKAISNNEQTIYQDHPVVDYIGGVLFVTMGIAVFAILAYIDRKKKNTR